MFRKSFYILGIWFSAHYAQAQWFNLVSGTTQNLFGVNFKNTQEGFVVGGSLDKSTILRTMDGGDSWIVQEFTSTKYLYDVKIIDSAVVVACGYAGVIYRSQDNGQNWSMKPSQTTEWLYALTFVNSQVGFAVGGKGTLIKTTNGGNNWQEKNSGTNVLLLDISFSSDTLGVAVGKTGRIIKTNDGGETWKNINTPYLETLNSVHFLNKDTVWAVGENGRVIYSYDAGETWTSMNFETDVDFQSIYFVNEKAGYIISKTGVYRTENAGLNWTYENPPVITDLHQIHMVNNEAYIVGKEGTIIKNTQIPLFLTEDLSNDDARIFPNPSNAFFEIHIATNTLFDVEVYSLDGKLLWKKNQIAAGEKIATENFSSGMYICKIRTKEQQFISKIIITK